MMIINQPIRELFFDLAAKAEKSIKICSPYIKHSVVNELYKAKKETSNISVVTRVNLMNFYKNSSDISAIKEIQGNLGEIYNCQRLHAKLYIFDDKETIVTSANFTHSGFNRNYEYGVLISEKSLVDKTCDDFRWLCNNESSGKIKEEHINEIQKILGSIPKTYELELPKLELDYSDSSDEIFDMDLKYIADNLTGWKKDTFQGLKFLNKQIFTTEDLRYLLPELKKKYRNNNTVEASLRRNLQELRDLGLIKFEGNGVYKKLWK